MKERQLRKKGHWLIDWWISISITSGATIKLFESSLKMMMSAQITFKFLVKLTFYQELHETEVISVTKSDRLYEIQIKEVILFLPLQKLLFYPFLQWVSHFVIGISSPNINIINMSITFCMNFEGLLPFDQMIFNLFFWLMFKVYQIYI